MLMLANMLNIPNRRRENSSLRIVGVMARGYGDTNLMMRIDYSNISRRPAGTGEDKRKGVEGEDLTVVEQFNVRHAGDESGHFALSSGQDCMFRKESSYNDSEHKNIKKWNNKVDGNAWDGYSVHEGPKESIQKVDLRGHFTDVQETSIREQSDMSKSADLPKLFDKQPASDVIKSADKDPKPDKAKSADKDPKPDKAKSADKIPIPDKAKTGDEISVLDKAETGDKISVLDKAKMGDEITIPYKDKTGDKISILDKAKTGDEISIPDKAKTGDEISVLDKAKTGDEISVLNKAITGDKISVLDKAKMGDEISVLDKTKMGDEISIPDKAKMGDKISVPDKAKMGDKISVPDKTKMSDKISIPDKSKKGDKISIPDKDKTSDKISIPDKAKMGDEISVRDKAKTDDEISVPDKARTGDEISVPDKAKTGDKISNFATKANSTQTGVQAGGCRDNKFGLKVNGTDEICDDAVKSFKCSRDVALGSGTFSLPQVLFTCTIIFFFHCGTATRLKPPVQELPGKCLSIMDKEHGNDCPQYDDPFFESWYTPLNETCCASYPYLDFHCQMEYQKSGEQLSMVACLRTVEVPEGHSGRMMGYDTSDPYFKVEKLDDTKLPKPTRESWQVTNSYHPHAKISCTGLGQQLLCLGIGEDNRCTCEVGFYPNGKDCKSGFGAEDACDCQHLDCSGGSHAARNFSKEIGGSCDDLDLPSFTAEFICKENATPASSISSTTQSTFSGSSTTSHPPNTGGDDDGKKDSKTAMIVALVVVFSVIVAALVVLIKNWAIVKAKLSSVCRHGNENGLKDCDSSSVGSELVDNSPGSVSLASASATSESVV